MEDLVQIIVRNFALDIPLESVPEFAMAFVALSRIKRLNDRDFRTDRIELYKEGADSYYFIVFGKYGDGQITSRPFTRGEVMALYSTVPKTAQNSWPL